jgi:hypothetical protein
VERVEVHASPRIQTSLTGRETELPRLRLPASAKFASAKLVMPRRKKDSDRMSSKATHRTDAASAESLAKKLGVKPDGMAIALLWAPDGFAERIGVEEGNYDTDLVTGIYDLILFFTASRVLLREFFPIAINRMEPNGRIWICWPKKSEGQKTDLTTDTVETLAESLDLIETSRCVIEEIWSGIKYKKGMVTASPSDSEISSIAPYSISVMSSIPITPDEGKE